MSGKPSRKTLRATLEIDICHEDVRAFMELENKNLEPGDAKRKCFTMWAVSSRPLSHR